MNGTGLGLRVRALRVHKRLRQEDVAGMAKVSRSFVSKVERGLVDNVTVRELEHVVAALGGSLDVRMRWRGEALDRLLDEAHARLVDRVVRTLKAAHWEVVIEASFSIWGERGSIDVLARHPRAGTVLVVEVKSVVPDSQAMLHTLDRKARLAREVAKGHGWGVSDVARLLVVGESATSRRRIARLSATYYAALPLRGWAVRRWLARPSGSISGLLFLSPDTPGGARGRGGGLHRVRRANTSPDAPETAPSAPMDGG